MRCNQPDLLLKETLVCLIESANRVLRKLEKSVRVSSELNVINPKFIMPSNPEVDDTDVLPRTKTDACRLLFQLQKEAPGRRNSENLPKSDEGDEEKQCKKIARLPFQRQQ